MPQFDQLAEVAFSQFFWLLLTLGIIYFGIARGMVPKVQQTVDARDKRIADDLAAAERARAEADEVEEEYRGRINAARGEVSTLILEAKSSAALATQERLAGVDADLDASANQAAARLAEARARALGEIESVAAEAARAIVARISGATVEPKAAADAVSKAMAHG